MQYTNSIPPRRSLGALRRAPKTKAKSPDTLGTMKVQRHTIEAIMKQLDEVDADEVDANIAGWFNHDHSGQYLTVELSPRYVPKQQVQRQKPINMFDMFFQEKEDVN